MAVKKKVTRVVKPKIKRKKKGAAEIGDRIKELRIAQNITQEDMAKKLNLKGRGNVSMLELGLSYPTLKILTAISEKFHVSYDWLIKGTTMPEHDKMKQEIKKLAEENELLKEHIQLLKQKRK